MSQTTRPIQMTWIQLDFGEDFGVENDGFEKNISNEFLIFRRDIKIRKTKYPVTSGESRKLEISLFRTTPYSYYQKALHFTFY